MSERKPQKEVAKDQNDEDAAAAAASASEADGESESGSDAKPSSIPNIVKYSQKVAAKSAKDTQSLMERYRALVKTKDLPFTTAVLEVPKKKDDPKPSSKGTDAKAPSVKAPSKKEKAEEERRERVAKAKKERDAFGNPPEAICDCFAFDINTATVINITLSGDEVVGKKGAPKELKLEIPLYRSLRNAIVPFEVVMSLISPDHKLDEQLISDASKYFQAFEIVPFHYGKDPKNLKGGVGIPVWAWINQLVTHLLQTPMSQYHKVLTARGVKSLIPKLMAFIYPASSPHCKAPPAPKSKASKTSDEQGAPAPAAAAASAPATPANTSATVVVAASAASNPKSSAPKKTKETTAEPMKDGDDDDAAEVTSPKTKVNGKRSREEKEVSKPSSADDAPKPEDEGDGDEEVMIRVKRRKIEETPVPAPAPTFESPPATPVPAPAPDAPTTASAAASASDEYVF